MIQEAYEMIFLSELGHISNILHSITRYSLLIRTCVTKSCPEIRTCVTKFCLEIRTCITKFCPEIYVCKIWFHLKVRAVGGKTNGRRICEVGVVVSLEGREHDVQRSAY